MKSCSINSATFLRAFFVLATAACLALLPKTIAGADADGVALAIVYDTSGGMKEPARTADGKQAAKWIIGNRALEQIVHRIQKYVTSSVPARTIHAGLYVFR